MKQGDTVGDFRDRLNILLMGAESALKEDKGAEYVPAMMTPIKEAAIDIFISGLPGNISAAVDASHPEDLEAAYKEGVRIEARIRSRILPDSRHSAQMEHYAEQSELSQNTRSFLSRLHPWVAARSPSQETGPSPGLAFVGYLEPEAPLDNHFDETALTYSEADPSFIGYVSAGPNYQPQGQNPSQDPRPFANSGYPPRRGRGGRGGYPGQNRPNAYSDPCLYNPHASTHLPADQGRGVNDYGSLIHGVGNLNLQGARPNQPSASPSMTMNPPLNSPATPKPPNHPPGLVNRVLLARPQEALELLPVELLEKKIQERTTPQW